MGDDDDDDIMELSTLFDNNNNTANNNNSNLILQNSNKVEEEVINELALRIEEKFMLSIAKQENDLEKSCQIIYDVVMKNPTSNIINKNSVKNIATQIKSED